MKRLWISSLEESAIRDGFYKLKSSSAYDNLYQAGFCRAKADWHEWFKAVFGAIQRPLEHRQSTNTDSRYDREA